MHTLTHQELRELALSKRQVGVLTFEFRERSHLSGSPESTADSFVASLGFKQLGKAWRVIDRAAALGCLQHILYHDLAYQQPLMEQKTAQFIAESFLALFSAYDCRFCTNGSFDERSMLGWTPITESTFDHGVIAFDEKRIGMIWAQDED
jgi:hypothetical protein